ncbi:hypothetical protein NQ318_002564 [Aromia moschata]|uniref:Uncharacterized protein n=1 Tax=Aromia moschata TaxID=1265417 RepID=A0AAV8Y704_9CUCU|nr:hypothetical protein NQ318_002564 [Aromia moschata]
MCQITWESSSRKVQYTKNSFARELREGRETTEDDLRPGRPSRSITDENIGKIGKLILEDRRLSIRGLAEITGIDKECVRQILHESFNMSKVCAKTPNFRAKGIKNEHDP